MTIISKNYGPFLGIVWLLFAASFSCSDNTNDSTLDGGTSGNSDADTDSDTDADSDADSDADADTDSDSDADTDSDADDDDDDDNDNNNDDNDNDNDDDTGGDDDDDNDDDNDDDTGDDDDSDLADGGAYLEKDPNATNPFFMVTHDPFSTFAADVDTASYDILRRDINNGSLPASDTVRLEEFVNYFPYKYEEPEASSEHPIAINLTAAPSIADDGTILVRASARAKGIADLEKKPANVVFLIDKSGSMSAENKLPLIKHLLKSTLSLLEEGDKIALVTYASGTQVHLESTDASQSDAIAAAIDALDAGGSTNGEAGINLAYQEAEKGFIDGGINHVVLCTDGDFNVGMSGADDLVTLIEEKRELGISLTVLGVGNSHNDYMMEKLSNAGDGTYSVITSKGNADDFVEKRMLSGFVQVAKDVKIQVEFNPAFVKAYRLLGYENRELDDDDFNNHTVDAGEIGAGHKMTALYQVVLADGSIPQSDSAPDVEDGDPVEGEREIDPKDLALFKVHYKMPGSSQADPSIDLRVSMTPSQIAGSMDDVDVDMRWAAAVASFAEILKNSPYGDRDELDIIEDIITEQDWLETEKSEFVTIFGQARVLLQD